MCFGNDYIVVQPFFKSWLLLYYQYKNNKISEHSEKRQKINNLKEIYNQILPGTHILFFYDTQSHLGICSGYDQDGELKIMHQIPIENEKFDFTAHGKIRVDTLSKLVNTAELGEFQIRFCLPNVNDPMCRTATLHRVYLALIRRNEDFNFRNQNCQIFIWDNLIPPPISNLPQFSDIAFIFLSIFLISWISLFGYYFEIGLGEIICAIFGVIFLIMGWSFFSGTYAYIDLRHTSKDYFVTERFHEVVSNISVISDYDQFLIMKIDYKKRDWQEKLHHLENDALLIFYDSQRLLAHYEKHTSPWLILQKWAVRSALFYLSYRFHYLNGLALNKARHQLAISEMKIFIRELDIFAMAFEKIESKEIAIGYKQLWSWTITSLAILFSPGNVKRKLIAPDNDKSALAKSMCKDLFDLILNHPNLLQIDDFDSLRICLEMYWYIVESVSKFGIVDMADIERRATDIQYFKWLCQDLEVQRIYQRMITKLDEFVELMQMEQCYELIGKEMYDKAKFA